MLLISKTEFRLLIDDLVIRFRSDFDVAFLLFLTSGFFLFFFWASLG